MKKFLFVALLCLGFGVGARAQPTGPSAADTITWIRGELESYSVHVMFAGNLLAPTVSEKSVMWEYSEAGVTFDLKWSAITKMNFNGKMIDILGAGTACRSASDCGTVKILKLDASKMPQDEAQRLMKALTHMAELNGAKLVKNDLF